MRAPVIVAVRPDPEQAEIGHKEAAKRRQKKSWLKQGGNEKMLKETTVWKH